MKKIHGTAQRISFAQNFGGQHKHINSFNLKLLGSTPKTHLGAQGRVYVPHFLGKNTTNDPHKLSRGVLG